MKKTTQKIHEKIAVGNRVKIVLRGKKRIWTAEFWFDGEHRRLSLKTNNKKIAIDRATKIENELLHGTFRQVRHEVTLAQVQQILAVSSSMRRAMFAVLAFSGMRSGELRQLRREDVDLAGGWFQIVSRQDAQTKTKTSRKVPMHPVLQELLRTLPASNGPWFFCAEPSAKFPNGDHWLSTKKLNEAFLGRLKTVGLPAGRDTEGGYTIHSLRHFTETHCVNAGIPQRVVDTWHRDK